MFLQPGSIHSPGTSIQGRLFCHSLLPGSSNGATGRGKWDVCSVLPGILGHCGTPAVLSRVSGRLDVFAAGQVASQSSPSLTSWPLSPIHVYKDELTEDWKFDPLPNTVDGRSIFVSGIPSAVSTGVGIFVYLNGAQLLEFSQMSGHPWQVAAIPSPDIVVEANPVATISSGSVFVFSAPNSEYLLSCSRPLGTQEWTFKNLSSRRSRDSRTFDGDPAAVSFAGQVHVLVCVVGRDRSSSNQPNCELQDIVVDPVSLKVSEVPVSAGLADQTGKRKNAVVGTPAAVATPHGIEVFTRTEDHRLLQFSSADGKHWSLVDISATTMLIGGDPGAMSLEGGHPLVCAADAHGNLVAFRFDAYMRKWNAMQISDGVLYVQGRPVPIPSDLGISVFDLNVPL